MKLDLNDPTGFATGACYYDDNPPDEPLNRRLVIPIRFAGEDWITRAVVDTGAPWSVLNPNHANNLTNYALDADNILLQIPGIRYKGELWRIPVTMLADTGVSLTIEANFFVPKSQNDLWSLPDFIGLQGFLDRIRFAVDPEENLFYFGALGDA